MNKSSKMVPPLTQAAPGRSVIARPHIMFSNMVIPLTIYLLSIVIYLHPLTMAPIPSERTNDSTWKLITDPTPQLDEIHIQSHENHDITGDAPWTEAWYNDYWGRPISNPSSHKSWRPLTVWSFRFCKGGSWGKLIVGFWGKFIGGLVELLISIFGGRGFRSNKGNPMHFDHIFGGKTVASDLFVHRFVNVMIHAAIVQLVGVISMLLFPPRQHQKLAKPESQTQQQIKVDEHSQQLSIWTKYLAQLLFAFHPVHVESVANVANRPHLLALLFNATIMDPNVSLIVVAVLATLGLLSSETAIFQYPAIILTITAIRYRELRGSNQYQQHEKFKNEKIESKQSRRPMVEAIISLFPRYVLLVAISFTYLSLRHYYDTLSIPNGLIRPAENPFYDKLDKGKWSIAKRAVNYSYILSLHIMKSFGMELIGFSHEYGYDCIPEIIIEKTKVGGSGDGSRGAEVWMMDMRLLLPVSLVLIFVGLSVWCWFGWKMTTNQRDSDLQENSRLASTNNAVRCNEERTERLLYLTVFLSWMVTLFPISGILKVGTFVADRIAMASTFGACIFGGRQLSFILVGNINDVITTSNGNCLPRDPAKDNTSRVRILKILPLFYVLQNQFARRTHLRAAEWMDSVSLLQSSLESCPRSIKSNLEMSKIYSGLVPHMMNLEKALSVSHSDRYFLNWINAMRCIITSL